ncbi:MAG: 6-carboxytetrahydropterin synthase [Candidatus Eremiobacteraeota bacterium]|nr:6-carboxytetrahydropterin synthase [Candidatus Eremiobacteraeota bacterium]MBV8364985.1 6-carboxytetrahydropterin synthase [Candidatus Eremiobacteraeota bacterium]
MITISTSCHFDAAHQLALPYESPCNRPHGHRYIVDVVASAETLEHGMVVDFNVIKGVVDEFDHRDLNTLADFASMPSTAENIAIVLARKLQEAAGARVSIDEVTVRESPQTSARWKK